MQVSRLDWTRIRRCGAWLLLLVGLWSAPAAAESVPAEQQALLLLRVLAYDRALSERSGAAVTVLVLTGGGDCGDLPRVLAARAARVSVAGKPVKVVQHAWGAADLQASLGSTDVDAVYRCPELTAPAAAVGALARSRKALSFSSIEADARSGISIAIAKRGASTALVVNPESARAEGAALDAALLRLAEIVK